MEICSDNLNRFPGQFCITNLFTQGSFMHDHQMGYSLFYWFCIQDYCRIANVCSHLSVEKNEGILPTSIWSCHCQCQMIPITILAQLVIPLLYRLWSIQWWWCCIWWQSSISLFNPITKSNIGSFWMFIMPIERTKHTWEIDIITNCIFVVVSEKLQLGNVVFS